MVVYYETLCPECRQYLSFMVFPTFVMLSDIMSLTVVPYGNARVGSPVFFCCFSEGGVLIILLILPKL